MSLALSVGARRHRAWAQTLHAEWTKLRTLASTGWLLLAAVGGTGGGGAPGGGPPHGGRGDDARAGS
jgi:hypothetical protein